MMTRRKRITIILLIFLAFVLLLLWLYFAFFSGKESVKEEVVEPVPVEEEEIIPTRPTISEQELETERQTRNNSSDVVSLSKTFVTRFGSYSNEANFANLIDVLPLVSNTFATQLQRIIDTGEIPEEYYGVSTSVITVNVDEKDESAGTAQVTITAQREEAIGSPQNTSVKYQDIVLTFVKEDSTWKVDSATWQ